MRRDHGCGSVELLVFMQPADDYFIYIYIYIRTGCTYLPSVMYCKSRVLLLSFSPRLIFLMLIIPRERGKAKHANAYAITEVPVRLFSKHSLASHTSNREIKIKFLLSRFSNTNI